MLLLSLARNHQHKAHVNLYVNQNVWKQLSMKIVPFGFHSFLTRDKTLGLQSEFTSAEAKQGAQGLAPTEDFDKLKSSTRHSLHTLYSFTSAPACSRGGYIVSQTYGLEVQLCSAE